MINRHKKFLAGSPDGLVKLDNGEEGLLEVKNLCHEKPINLWEAASSVPNFCLEKVNGKLSLKKTHDYFYQCHGLMNVCGYPWIDFVVRTLNPYQIHIQRIYIDNKLWNDFMLPKLESFYMKAILPELACPRQGKSPGIREPGVWHLSNNKTIVRRKRTGKGKNSTKCTKRQAPSNTRKGRSTSKTDTHHEPSTSSHPILVRSKRNTSRAKFVGRSIRHQWIIDENTDERQWYRGYVLGVVSGRDGQSDAVYQVSYEGEDDTYEVDHLLDDYRASKLMFTDL